MPTDSQLIKIACTKEQKDYILKNLSMEQRAGILLLEAGRASGQAMRDRLSTLSEQNQSALLTWPIFCNGDSSDMETYLLDVWRGPVTDDNLRQIAEGFRVWYQIVAPNEYRDPHEVKAEMNRSGLIF